MSLKDTFGTFVSLTLLAAMYGGFLFGCVRIAEWTEGDRAERERRQLADTCIEWWRAESRMSRLLDGPYVDKDCRRYFATRTDAQATEDEARWRQQLENARREWQEYRERQNGD